MEFDHDDLNAEGEIPFADDIGKSSSRVLAPEKHLDSPILVSLLERLLTTMEDVIKMDKYVKPVGVDPHRIYACTKFLKKHPERGFSNFLSPFVQYANCLDYCKKSPTILDAHDYAFLYSLSAEHPYRLQSDFHLAKRIHDREMTTYLSYLSDILKPDEISRLRKQFSPPDQLEYEVVLTSNRAQLWSDIVDIYRVNYKNNRRPIKRSVGPLRVITADGFVLLKHELLDTWKLATYEQLQMVQDCCLARHNVQLALRFKFHNGSSSLESYVSQIIRWQESVLTAIGNDGFELVKAPEAVFKAWLNSLTSGDLLSYSSYDRTLDKIREKERKLHGSIQFVQALHHIVQSVTSIHDAAELFGLSKLSGHPAVYAIKSALSVRKEAEPKGTILPHAVTQLNRMFKHITLSGYINRHSSWPNFRCEPALGTVLRRHFNNRVTTLPLGSYPISDLDAIEFRQFVNFDYSEDYLKFLDDKAICPGAREMSKFWYSGQRQESRRLLQKILEIEKFDTRETIDRLRHGGFRSDEMVVELTQKERELKVAARCFCKLPFHVRTFFTCTEYNLKEHFMKQYMPQQTMTMSNSETKQRMYQLVKDAKSKGRTLLEVDFSRWNLKWRYETVNGISRILEDIFGLPGVFSQAHPFFTNATVVMTDKNTLPQGALPSRPITEWPQSELLWRGTHLGGFEGIQQALWTICTVSMMYWVIHDQNMAFNMAGQGDNQIFAITFDTSKEKADDQLRKLLAIMEIRCKLLNHEVKPDECIDSTTVLTYSKEIYVEGVHTLYNLKFASRSFRREEIDVPSLSGEIASINASALACADSVYNSPLAIFWRTFQVIRYLSTRYRSPLYKIEKRQLSLVLQDSDYLEFLLHTPGSLGGLPNMPWTRFFIKGEVDDLSWDVSAIYHLSRFNPIILKDLKLLLRGNYSKRKSDLTQLLLDPHSIPIDRPKDLKRLVKDAVALKLPSLTKNRWIHNIISNNVDAPGRELQQQLIRTEPFYPTIMSDVYAMSPNGIKDALISRFTMTRTIVGITGNPNFQTEIEGANAALLMHLHFRYKAAKNYKSKTKDALTTTPYEICEKLRALWGPTVKHCLIGTYNPFQFALRFTDQRIPGISVTSRTSEGTTCGSIGPYPPNFGTKTRQKLSEHGFKITTSSSTVQDLKSLILTCSELGDHTSFRRLISSIVRSRSPWSVDELISILPTAYGGAAAHRHASINASAFAVLGSKTVPTHLNFSSDNSGVLVGGEYDYPVAFQEFYLTLTHIVQVLTTNLEDKGNISLSFELPCNLQELPDDPVKVPDSSPIKWNILSDNKLCYVTELQLEELPTVPQATQIPHTTTSDVLVEELLTSYLLHKYSKRVKLLRIASSSNLPIELIDFKEFNHSPLDAIIRGVCWFIQIMACYAAVQDFHEQMNVFLHEYVLILSKSCASVLARTMLHPSHYDTIFSIESGIACTPGVSGGKTASERLSGELYARVMLSIRAKDLLVRQPKLLLFEDYAFGGLRSTDMLCTTLLALSGSSNAIRVSNYEWLLLRTAYYPAFSSTTDLDRILIFQAVLHSLARSGNRSKTKQHSPRLRLSYINKTADEAIRDLRKRPVNYVLHLEAQTCPNVRRTLAGEIKYTVDSSIDGSLLPLHTCEETLNEHRLIDRFLSYCQRPIGIYSSALSIWLQVLSRCNVKDTPVLSIGVGHGAVAAASLYLNSPEATGIDIRSSFPAIVQRESAYYPPEVVLTGRSRSFHWSPFISSTGGDVLTYGQALTPYTASRIVVIDIEQDYHRTLDLVNTITNARMLIVRQVCCVERAQYLIDQWKPSRVYCTSQFLGSHLKSYIYVDIHVSGHNAFGNHLRASIISARPWRSSIDKSRTNVISYFNRWIGPTGEQIVDVTVRHNRDLVSRLQDRLLNTNTTLIRQQLQSIVTELELVTDLFETPTDISVKTLGRLSHSGTRALGIWFANSGLDLNNIIEQLQ